jgi:cobalt/nickel transport system permease protein
MDKYALGGLLPFFAFPITILALSGVPAALVVKRVALVAPFAILVGLFNPLIDREILLRIGETEIAGGWVSFLSILLRFALTIGALILLVATSSLPSIGIAAERLGAPRIFVAQIIGLYRYLFLLTDETERTLRAWRLRSGHGKPPSWRMFARILGQLLLRAIERAGRVYEAMRCRGFEGELKMIGALHFRPADGLFLAGWLGLFLALRFLHPAEWLGRLALGLAS